MHNKEKIILVTGSSRGIGRGIAIELAKNGYSVAINYAGNKDAAIDTKQLCIDKAINAGFNSRFEIFQGDISIDSSRKELVKSVIEYFGDIHGLVNNAGISPKKRDDLLDMSEDSFDRIMNTNLKGSFFLSKLVANYWVKKTINENDTRTIIFMTSVSSEMVSLNRGEYCIAKSALSMANKLFATRLASENINVFELRPGIIETDMTGGVKDKYDKLIGEGLVPQKRWGKPEDIGKSVLSLVNGNFPFSTGSIIHIDGALHIPSF